MFFSFPFLPTCVLDLTKNRSINSTNKKNEVRGENKSGLSCRCCHEFDLPSLGEWNQSVPALHSQPYILLWIFISLPSITLMVIGTSLREEILWDRSIEQTADNQTNIVQTQHVDCSVDFHPTGGLECKTVCTHTEANERGFVHNAGFLVEQFYVLKGNYHSLCLLWISIELESLYLLKCTITSTAC